MPYPRQIREMRSRRQKDFEDVNARFERTQKRILIGGISTMAIFVLVTIFVMVVPAGAFTVKDMTCTVTSKSTGVVDGYSQYRVHTSDCGTLSVEDSILDGRFETAEVYGAIEEGQRYHFTTRGNRVGFISNFPNIIEFTPTR